MNKNQVVVIGAGLAGLRAASLAAGCGRDVLLMCRLPGGRSASSCAQGGINAALNNYDDGDTPFEHFRDTIAGGAFLADQKPVLRMCEAAPDIIGELTHNGALFNRLPDGKIDQRYFGGSKKRRTCFVGASTGQALVLACESMARYYEAAGKITRAEGFEFLSVAKDGGGRCAGVVAQHVASGEIRGFPASAVVAATGGGSRIYGKSTNPIFSNGSAAAALYLQGAALANPEFVQFHPTAMLGSSKTRLISEGARGEGGRLFTYKDGAPWYFLEEMFPEWGNLITRDKASQAIYYVCNELGLGIERYAVLLSISHLPEETRRQKLQSVIELYCKYGGADPDREPMKVFPAAHYFMGGLYVDDNHMTTMPGVFAAGECDYAYHGANRLGGNSLLSSLYGVFAAGLAAALYEGETSGDADRILESEVRRQQDMDEKLKKMNGAENPYILADHFGIMLRENLFIVRYNEILEFTDDVILNYMKRWENINILDTGRPANHTVLFVRQLRGMMEYARVMAKAALLRNESRGAHYKPDFPQRDDARFLKTTVASYGIDGSPAIRYRDVDTSLLEVRIRNG
jgi:succinate dehydrogenase / fumarate reductase flavoprotein subunit